MGWEEVVRMVGRAVDVSKEETLSSLACCQLPVNAAQDPKEQP
jgi:hypothetical protein